MTLKNVSFCNYNYADSDATITVSSEHATYAAANASNVIRTKIWQPTGNFEITTSNNVIRYDYGGGIEDVNVATGTYTAAELATAVQTALNSPLASSGWTCTYSTTTLKFTIAIAGGDTLYFNFTTNTIWDTLGYTSGVETFTDSFVADEQRIHTSEWYKVDNGAAKQVNAVCVICPQTEIFGISTLGSVRFQGNNLDAWDAPSLDVELTVGERGIFKFFDEDVTDTEYRYHRIKFIDPQNPDGSEDLRVGFIYIGDIEHIDSSNVGQGFSKAQEDPSTVLESENGQRYYDTRPKYDTFSAMSLTNVTATDRVKIEQVFNDFGIHTPLFISFDPGQLVETDPSVYTRYFYFDGKPNFTHLFLTYYAVSMSFRECL